MPRTLSDEDPLGVRTDFPITNTRTYLNSAYVGPASKMVRDTAVGYANEKLSRAATWHQLENKELARTRRLSDNPSHRCSGRILTHAHDQELADLVHVIVGDRAVVGTSIVDDDQIVGTPYVPVHKLRAPTMLEQKPEERRALA